MDRLRYIQGYPPELQAKAEALVESGELAGYLFNKYPDKHEVHSSKALNTYVQELKALRMRSAAPLKSVAFDNRLHQAHNALGLHTTSTVVQGSKLKKRREMRIASLFKDTAPEFLHMIVVHELAHMKHTEHDRDFYKLCTYMEPDYHQLEFDLRLHLTVLEMESAEGS
ncbi:MAG: putative metal-dependent hydrolase [Planctomycetota bacterium]|jgi:predicted metal-dependent hydrolase